MTTSLIEISTPECKGIIPIGYKSAKIDSRAVKKGDLFFAIKGENSDGHDFVGDAFRRKAGAAVVDIRWMKKHGRDHSNFALFGVDDTVSALGELARIHRTRYDVPVLCIGGANGKTTTKDLVSAVLATKYRVLKTEGNLNNHLGLPMTLLNLNKEHKFCVLEVGCSHFGEIRYLCGIADPDAGLVTNIGKEHLEFFKDLNGVAKAEFELYDFLKSKTDAVSFFNLDDSYIRKYSKSIPHERKCTYSYGFEPDVKGTFKGYGKDLQPRFEVTAKGKSFEVQVSTFGKHSIYNGLAAAAVGNHFGIPKAMIRKALKTFTPTSSKRMELLRHNGMLIINDSYNSNPDSVKMGLETMMEAGVSGERHAVLGDMLELGKASTEEHSRIGRIARKLGVRNLYTFGKESLATFRGAKGVSNNFHFESKEDLAEMLRRRIGKGDLVYVKGSRGMKMEEIVNSITGK
ncbi:MAG: UDP-N-acetylmuramoyl-tripeptide--D-alanyl-D-alanine ligase [Ignavibacteria bacterium]|nr:UDP-N-acetylmuramoyl-tripeptide--D-alanyl-D-alanine ligase [Ignavibacteria bacterium]